MRLNEGIQVADFQRTLLGQRRGRFAAREHLGGARQPRQRPVDEPHADGRADQRQQQRRGAPAQPFDAAGQADLLALEDQPVQVLVDLEADPEAGYLVDPPGDLGFGSETHADMLRDPLPVVVVGQRLGEVGELARVDLDAFVGGQVQQQLAALVRMRIDQGRTRDIDGRDHPLRHLIGARLQLHAEEDLQPGAQADQHQCREQQKGASEQAETQPRGQVSEQSAHAGHETALLPGAGH
ncbi:hypothetical protein BBB37_13900 [Bordetella pertussis]|nr:hypothetical protein BBB37_13900 [Bordetella pertussis]